MTVKGLFHLKLFYCNYDISHCLYPCKMCSCREGSTKKPCAVTALFLLAGESHQHLGIQELLHRAGPAPWCCRSCEANVKFGRVGTNLPRVFGLVGGAAVAFQADLPPGISAHFRVSVGSAGHGGKEKVLTCCKSAVCIPFSSAVCSQQGKRKGECPCECGCTTRGWDLVG